jgi:hypothetical protein
MIAPLLTGQNHEMEVSLPMASHRSSPTPCLAPPMQTSGAAISAQALVAQVARLARERDELARRVAILDAKLIEVTDAQYEREVVRAMYRRGYFAGRAARRRGAPAAVHPERHARGWVREVLAA